VHGVGIGAEFMKLQVVALCTNRKLLSVFSALYAAYLRPELRVTSNQLSAIINGVATVLMFMFIDPYLSMLTDELVEEKWMIHTSVVQSFG